MDNVFGTLHTQDQKVLRHRLARRGIYHGHRVSPARPAHGEPITLFVTTGPDVAAKSVTYHGPSRDGAAQHIPFKKVSTTWDNVVWGYVTDWEVKVHDQTEDTLLRYRISAESISGQIFFADHPLIIPSSEAAGLQMWQEGKPVDTNFFLPGPAEGHEFVLPVGLPPIPEWARKAIVYHIMVDRFYPGDGKAWLQTEDLWERVGGTLWGVFQKMDYIADLGFNCIWLSPVWDSPTHHGYDTIDYRKVAPHFGGDEALHAVIEAAHSRGIKVLLDMACNHCSTLTPEFLAAKNNPSSPQRSWFYFDDSERGFRTYFDTDGMPEVNLLDSGARKWMIETALYWMQEFGVDGYRLDYANGPGPDFWAYFAAACKEAKPDCWLFGEIVDAPEMLWPYVSRLDGCLDFSTADALRSTYGWKSWKEDQLERFLSDHITCYPDGALMPVFIDNHDMNRFSFIADDNQRALLAALEHLFQLPGPPIIYYGTEVGVLQEQSAKEGLHVSRVPMRWGLEQDETLRMKVMSLVQNRKARMA